MSARRPKYPVGAGQDPRVPLQYEQAPRTINYSVLEWDAIMAILRDAERGNTTRLADLTRRMLTDGHLASNVETRKLAIATAKVAIEPASDDPIDVRGAEDAQRMIDSLPVSRIKKDMADAIFVGWSCLQTTWEPRDAWLWPKEVRWNHPRRFRFGYDFKPYIYDDGRAMSDQHKLTPEQREECIRLGVLGMPLEPYRWIVHMPRSFPDYPQMGGVLLSAIRPWWIKAGAVRYQLDGAEIAGNGRLWGEQDPMADATTKAAFLENLQKLGAGEIITTSPGAKINFVNPMAQGSSSIWSTLIQECNAEMSKAILGSTLAVEAGPTGSRAQAETQKAATIDPRAEVDDDEIRYTLHRDLVDVFLELNRWAYGGRKPNVKTLSVWIEEEASIDELALKTGLVKKNQFLQSRGLPTLDVGGDEFVTLPDAAPAFGGFSAPPAAVGAAEPKVAPVLPDIEPGSSWTDTSDGHTVKVTAIGGGRVYFTDADYVDPKAGPQPERQHSYAEPTFRERCIPKAAPGGAPAGLPLREGSGDRGSDGDATLSSEAHGDLWALADEARASALIAIGHPGLLTAQAMLDGVPLFERMRDSLISACGKATSTATLSGALAKWEKRKDAALTDQLYEVALQGRMGGALFVAQYEAPEVFAGGPVALDDRRVPPFLALPFDEAIAAFERRRVVSPDEFAAMDERARADAFTATRLAHETLVQRARDLLLRTLRDGGTFEEFRRALVEDEAALGVTPSAPWYLETVYRTNVQMAYGAGRLDLLTSPAVVAARPYLERRTARDDRVRETHAALEGAIFENGSATAQAYAPPYLDGALQFNCFPGETLVEGAVIAAVRAWYSGEMVEILTDGGRRLAVTPNHPLAAPHGFVPAGSVREGQDVLAYDGGVERLVEGHVDPQQPPTRIDEVFDTIAVRNGAASVGVVVQDFHGDAEFMEGHVDVVAVDGVLLGNSETKAARDGCHGVLVPSLPGLSGEIGGGAARDLSVAALASADGVVGRLRPAPALLGSPCGPLKPLRLGLSSSNDACLAQPAGHDVAGDASFLRDLILRSAGNVRAEKVISVRRFDFSGHVYDLQTAGGWMVAQGIVTSNCRCVLVARRAEDVDLSRLVTS